MGEDEIEPIAADHVGDGFDIALDGSHPIGDAGFARPPQQRRQRVDAHVEDGDAGTRRRQRNGEPAGATAAVEHRARPPAIGPSAGHEQLVDLHRQRDVPLACWLDSWLDTTPA